MASGYLKLVWSGIRRRRGRGVLLLLIFSMRAVGERADRLAGIAATARGLMFAEKQQPRRRARGLHSFQRRREAAPACRIIGQSE